MVLVSLFQDYLAPEMVSHFVLHDKPVADVVKRLCSTLKDRSSPAEQADLYLNALKKVRKQVQPPLQFYLSYLDEYAAN